MALSAEHEETRPLVLSRTPVIIKRLGRLEYGTAYDAMRRFTGERSARTADEIWLTEHPGVYTVGLAGREAHFPRGAQGSGPGRIPLMRVDRGGQITYHGPGQAIAYVLVDLSRRALTVRRLVSLLEQSVIDLLAGYNVGASRRPGAPGVYVNGAKIAALGLRVRRGCCYHGIALNVDMDLTPFHAIDPCGYPGLEVTQTRSLGIEDDLERVSHQLAQAIAARLEEAR
jgi:lipoyl(octanoyl) transferase